MDGLSLTVSNTLLYFPGGSNNADGSDSAAGFIWGGTDAKLTIPLAQRADLFIEGGGGVMASAGGAGVWGARTRQNLRYNGTESDQIVVARPMVSLGLRYRADIGGN